MRCTRLVPFFLPLILVLAPSVRAGDKAADKPTVVVRVKSLNDLVQNVKEVTKLLGQAEVANQIEGLVKSKIGKDGLEGVDLARPFGAYIRYGKKIEDIQGVVLIPIKNHKTFLTLLDNVGVKYTLDKGIYTHKTDKGVDIYFRFEHDYLYATSVNIDGIQVKNLADPAKAFASAGKTTVSVVARLDQIPKEAKNVAREQLDKAIDAAKNQPQANQKEFRDAVLDSMKTLGTRILDDAAEVRFDFDLGAGEEMTVNFSVTGKTGSDLAKTIQALGDRKSPLAGILKKEQPFQLGVHFALPDGVKKAFIDVVSEARDGALKGILDETKKAQAKALFEAMMPTARAGEFQLVAGLVGPSDKHYTFIGAMKLQDGAKLGKTVHDLIEEAVKSMPKDKRGMIQLNADSVGAVKIHRFELPQDAQTEKLVELAGERDLYLAFREDAVFIALGKDAKATLKAALAKTDGVASPAFLFDFDIARMAPLMAQTPEQKALANEFLKKAESGRVRVSIEGGGTLSAQLQMRMNVLQFLMKLNEKKE